MIQPRTSASEPNRWSVVIALWSAVASFSIHAGQEPDIVLEGLDQPCGVAVGPGAGNVFVAESGAGRIVRVIDHRAEDVITEFGRQTGGEMPPGYRGPAALAFQGTDSLVVAACGMKDGKDFLCVYSVPAVGTPPIRADQTTLTVGPLPEADPSRVAAGRYGLAVEGAAVFVTGGEKAKGWVCRANLHGSEHGLLETLISTTDAFDVGAPLGVTISPRGEIVVGQMGGRDIPEDSLLSFYNARTGKLLLRLHTGLYDISALAYSSKQKHLLYALDFAGTRPDHGGLYRLDAFWKRGRQTVQAVKIASLDKPTDMAFAPDGALYVTLMGTDAGGVRKTGRLVRFAPGL